MVIGETPLSLLTLSVSVIYLSLHLVTLAVVLQAAGAFAVTASCVISFLLAAPDFETKATRVSV